MSKLIGYFPTFEFGVIKESLIICDICGCRTYDENEPNWQRIGDWDYCPYCVNNPYADNIRKAMEK